MITGFRLILRRNCPALFSTAPSQVFDLPQLNKDNHTWSYYAVVIYPPIRVWTHKCFQGLTHRSQSRNTLLGVKAFNCVHTVTLSCFKAGFIALLILCLNIESIPWKSPSSLVFLEKDSIFYHLKVKENPFRGFCYASWHNVDTAGGNASVTDDLG